MCEFEQNCPYPDEPVEVLSFRYKSDLNLTRNITAVKKRKTEDADYIVSKPYKAKVKVKSVTNGKTYWIPICVPVGFPTDLCTSPPLMRPLMGRVGAHLEASIIHDWLFEAWHCACNRENPERRDHDFADDVFREAMKEARVRRWRRWGAYRASQCFGWKYFRSPSNCGCLQQDIT